MSDVADVFLLAAREALSFLERDHGFTLAESQAPFRVTSTVNLYSLTYRKRDEHGEDLFVRLSTAPARLELDLEFGRGWPPTQESRINVTELLAIESPGTELRYEVGIHEAFHDRDLLSDQYAALAAVLKRHGHRFFSLDKSLWDDIAAFRDARRQRARRERTSREAESAFKQGDWKGAVKLLESLGDDRTKLESARLAFARRQLR